MMQRTQWPSNDPPRGYQKVCLKTLEDLHHCRVDIRDLQTEIRHHDICWNIRQHIAKRTTGRFGLAREPLGLFPRCMGFLVCAPTLKHTANLLTYTANGFQKLLIRLGFLFNEEFQDGHDLATNFNRETECPFDTHIAAKLVPRKVRINLYILDLGGLTRGPDSPWQSDPSLEGC
jgi:hypothetical protein